MQTPSQARYHTELTLKNSNATQGVNTEESLANGGKVTDEATFHLIDIMVAHQASGLPGIGKRPLLRFYAGWRRAVERAKGWAR